MSSALLLLRRTASQRLRGRNNAIVVSRLAPPFAVVVGGGVPSGSSCGNDCGAMSFATTATTIIPPTMPETVMSGEDKTINRFTRSESIYKLGKHRSNALELVNAVPVIKVDGNIAVCDGGGGALGHPIEYIKLDGRDGKPTSCIYCGLRYAMNDDHHH
ncbi:hypothetical protein ACHAXA_009558 [Cyclostephanos tholiformis]|uniref:Zinc finger CHCC-type domain-containing protein n=1 Tax=Cyclostephanos tholiformis TaxID=382380 RepID=A0ABD3SE27_9STRA